MSKVTKNNDSLLNVTVTVTVMSYTFVIKQLVTVDKLLFNCNFPSTVHGWLT